MEYNTMIGDKNNSEGERESELKYDMHFYYDDAFSRPFNVVDITNLVYFILFWNLWRSEWKDA